jgi:ankyrin repeat protein
LAALNGQKKVVQCLLNNKGQTPLLLAVGQLHASIIELLVEKSA